VACQSLPKVSKNRISCRIFSVFLCKSCIISLVLGVLPLICFFGNWRFNFGVPRGDWGDAGYNPITEPPFNFSNLLKNSNNCQCHGK
jgi:hypothetical protein